MIVGYSYPSCENETPVLKLKLSANFLTFFFLNENKTSRYYCYEILYSTAPYYNIHFMTVMTLLCQLHVSQVHLAKTNAV